MGCDTKDKEVSQKKEDVNDKVDGYEYDQELNILDDKYRNYYEVFLYSYCDSNGDGVGDIKGLISKLDYINDGDDTTDSDLGYTGIWLMPIMSSTTYHKYDVVDYYTIDPMYGTMEDFKQLVEECHKRGIDLIIDFVMNHTSSQQEWFVKASDYLLSLPEGEEPDAKECPYIEYYNFSEGKTKVGTYAQLGSSNWYYECPFWDQMPDLNLGNEAVRREIEQIVDYWMDLGIDGFRLDAAKEYYSAQPTKNIEVLTWFNEYVKGKNQDAYIVAEVWDAASTYMEYYKSGIDSVFNFDFATQDGRITKVVRGTSTTATAKSFGEAMKALTEEINQIHPGSLDAPFFVNHDNARSAGYFLYDGVKTKMAAGLNLMMNGCTFTYYGEEIGMTGSGPDENKRSPMYWNDTGEGMTASIAQEVQENRFESVEKQMEDPLSIYNYNKRALRLRNENPEIARGTIAIIEEVTDPEICAITKTYDGQKIIMLYNISDGEKQITIPKSSYSYEGIRGYLSATGEKVTLQEETVTLPPYTIVILK